MKLTSERDFSCESLNFSIKEQMVMKYLGCNESAKMSDLSTFFSTPPTTMTSIVTRLVKKGYLERFRSKRDRRKVMVQLAPKGKKYCMEYKNKLEKMIRELTSVLSEEEQVDLLDLLVKVSEENTNRLKAQ